MGEEGEAIAGSIKWGVGCGEAREVLGWEMSANSVGSGQWAVGGVQREFLQWGAQDGICQLSIEATLRAVRL